MMIQGILRSPFMRYLKSLSSEDYLLSSTDYIELSTLPRTHLSLKKHKHKFVKEYVSTITWCDKCREVIFGIQSDAYKCTGCKFTCHAQCRPPVYLVEERDIPEESETACDPILPSTRAPQLGIDPESFPNPHHDSDVGSNHWIDDYSSRSGSSAPSSPFSTCSVRTSLNSSRLGRSYIRFDQDGDDLGNADDYDYFCTSATVTPFSTSCSSSSIPNIPACITTPPPTFSLLDQNRYPNDGENDLGTDEVGKEVPSAIGSYINIGFNILRPINVLSGEKVHSLEDVISSHAKNLPLTDDLAHYSDTFPPEPPSILSLPAVVESRELSAFFLPSSAVTTLYLTPDTTAIEVIMTFLTKFNILDNFRKFALYEKMTSPRGKVTLRKMDDEEKLLNMANHAFHSGEGGDRPSSPVQFILKDHYESEILWDSFSIPELFNFLRILEQEEEENVNRIRGKYLRKRIFLDKLLSATIILKNMP